MPDAQVKETVDGVEPSILVKFVDTTGPKSVLLTPTDQGAGRGEFSLGTTKLLTDQDLVVLAEVGAIVEVLNRSEPAVSTWVQPAVSEPEVVDNPIPSPGQ